MTAIRDDDGLVADDAVTRADLAAWQKEFDSVCTCIEPMFAHPRTLLIYSAW